MMQMLGQQEINTMTIWKQIHRGAEVMVGEGGQRGMKGTQDQ